MEKLKPLRNIIRNWRKPSPRAVKIIDTLAKRGAKDNNPELLLIHFNADAAYSNAKFGPNHSYSQWSEFTANLFNTNLTVPPERRVEIKTTIEKSRAWGIREATHEMDR
jgi:hypothetical protein